MTHSIYSERMGEHPTHLFLKLDTEQPVELSDFVGAFVAIGNQFERYAKERYPDAKVETVTYIKEVRSGCIEADLSPIIIMGAAALQQMDSALIAEDFVRRWGKRITALATGDKANQPNTQNELSDVAKAVAAIAADPNASHRLGVARYRDGKRDVSLEFQFDNSEARSALIGIDDRRSELTKTDGAQHVRKLMIFTRTDINDAGLGKRSGERVRINEISDSDLAIMYSSALAEERIKHEIREPDENVYKKGFVVDVNVQLSPTTGKPIMYAVTGLHDVIDLPDED